MPTLTRPRTADRIARPLWLVACIALAAWTLHQGVTFDGVASIGALLTLFIAATVSAFARRHLRSDPRRTQFFVNVGVFTLAVLSMILSADLVTFAAAWFLSGRLLADLIGHVRGWTDARIAALRASRTFLISDCALVAAVGLTIWLTGTTAMAPAVNSLALIGGAHAGLIAALLLIAAAARCALPPFSAWLLGSLATPTPVSALMHGGFVNAGAILLIRFGPLFEAAPLVQGAAILIGLSAAVYGILLMSVRPDIKGSLAASTVSQMGFMIASCGFGFYAAALWHMAAHGLFKAWLFLTAGSRIGIEQNRPQPEVTPIGAATIAAAALASGGAALALTGHAPLPMLLAIATGIAAIASTRRFGLLATSSAVFVAASIAIAELLQEAVLPAGSSPVSVAGQFAVAATFLMGWAYQQSRRSRTLPPRLFVHLLNAATITHSPAGAKA